MPDKKTDSTVKNTISPELIEEIMSDYRLARESREASLLGRREVLNGKAKFGIFGDGKELPQIALAKQFNNGDFRSGYYRDQTWMMAAGILTLESFFAQLYANTDIKEEPASAGRQMNGHFASRSLDENGNWKDLTKQKNSSADISPTAGQMPRLLGLAQASKVYRNHPELKNLEKFAKFSVGGDEIAFGSIGDASTSEGPFWESINAAGVLQIPMVMSIWDDGYGISVEQKYQTTKSSISEALSGMQRTEEKPGYEILITKGWDYIDLCATYEKAAKIAREEHVPVMVHVKEVTQPQGHSTSGSHERYKSKDRLAWEAEFDGIKKLGEWIIENGVATQEELQVIDKEAKKTVLNAKKAAWKTFTEKIDQERSEAIQLIRKAANGHSNGVFINKLADELAANTDPERKYILTACRKALRYTNKEKTSATQELKAWTQNTINHYNNIFGHHLFSESEYSPLKIENVAAEYSSDSELKDGREILKANFDYILENQPEALIFGEDAGKIGGVNQALEGLQEKYGELRVTDTGIRECTIIGQGIGMAMRGLRPIAEIQYLDYLHYAIQLVSDDLATVQYRSAGGQKAPLIIRTRGHRLEGIWHSGSPMGMVLNAIRGVHLCVPRNMTQAAGMYNTLMAGDDPAIVVESLNGYRLKEKMPNNIGQFKVKLGQPEIMKQGTDITLVTYGSMVRMVEEAAKQLMQLGINAEVIDIQTLLPFDTDGIIGESLQKTNRLLVIDEDVPGGASSFIVQEIVEKQNGYYHLDSMPSTLTAKAHRPPYGSDGDYFGKPSVDDIVDKAYEVMSEADPNKYPAI